MNKFYLTQGFKYLGKKTEVELKTNSEYAAFDNFIMAIIRAKETGWLTSGMGLFGNLDNPYRIYRVNSGTKFLVLDNRDIPVNQDTSKPFKVMHIRQAKTMKEVIQDIRYHGRINLISDSEIRWILKSIATNQSASIGLDIRVYRV